MSTNQNFEEKGEPKWYWTEALLLTSLMPTRKLIYVDFFCVFLNDAFGTNPNRVYIRTHFSVTTKLFWWWWWWLGEGEECHLNVIRLGYWGDGGGVSGCWCVVGVGLLGWWVWWGWGYWGSGGGIRPGCWGGVEVGLLGWWVWWGWGYWGSGGGIRPGCWDGVEVGLLGWWVWWGWGYWGGGDDGCGLWY